jgi:hypothetical protein
MKIAIFLSFILSILSKVYKECTDKFYKTECETCCRRLKEKY